MKREILTINGRTVRFVPGTTILEAASRVGIEIPSLCYLQGYDHFTSCMLCVVQDSETKRMYPACSMPIEPGMSIETENEAVREARKDTLDLLMSEHVGDCEAPCQRICPAGMNIPLMIRQIEKNHLDQAIATVKRDIALPAVLGRICPAPCEKGCNRKHVESPVSICLLKRKVADVDLEQTTPYNPPVKPADGSSVAIIGAGPAGLSAAYYLQQAGIQCALYDQEQKPGGQLRSAVPRRLLPEAVLDREIDRITGLGVRFHQGRRLADDLTWAELKENSAAIILAFGELDPEVLAGTEIEYGKSGITINKKTFETSVPGIFAGGNAVSAGRMAIRSAAHGKEIARSVQLYLDGAAVKARQRRFNSSLGKFQAGEVDQLLQLASKEARIESEAVRERGFDTREAEAESKRCLRCDCGKVDSCLLRLQADRYGASQNRFKFSGRKPLRIIVQHDRVIYEPGKCIKCGLCVQITREEGEKLGLVFIKRGFDVTVGTPFNESLSDALEKTAAQCISACPTGALCRRNRDGD